MHPFFRSPRHLLYAVVFWSPFCLGLAVLLKGQAGANLGDSLLLVTPPMFLLLILALSTWMICRFMPLAPRTFPRVTVTHILASAAMAAAGITAFHLQARLLADVSPATPWLKMEAKLRLLFFVMAIIIYFLAVFFNYLLMALDSSRLAERQLLQSELSRSRLELQALRATIHPHFLFNSLTALSVLIVQNPARGREICLQLADFLRFTLKMTQKRLIPLAEEIEHLRNYLGIEKVRLGDRLRVEWGIQPGLDACLVPPMLLQPLAENAVKHGIQTRLDGGTLQVGIGRQGKYLSLSVSNPLADEPDHTPPGTGLGLETIKKRLRDEFGQKAEAHIEKGAAAFSVRLLIPIAEHAPRS